MGDDQEVAVQPGYKAILETEDDGCTLYLNDSPVVSVRRAHSGAHKQVVWKIYGPLDIDQSIALVHGLLHLTAWLASERESKGQAAAPDEAAAPKRRLRRRRT